MKRATMDPILLEVIKNGLDTIADEIALIVMRTAYSAIVRDAMDYSTAICDAQGRTLAQGLTTPLHLGSFYDAMQNLIARYGRGLHDGDVFIFNDPYLAAGQHLPDIYIVKPIFIDRRLEGWATTVAHHNDVGGIVPGSNSIGSTEIYQEGLRLPVLKLIDGKHGENQAIWDIVSANVRVPDKVIGDLKAQLAAAQAGERAFVDLFRRYGGATMRRYFDEIHDYAERLARATIRGIPDGDYSFATHIDGFGEKPEPIRFQAKLSVRGDRVAIDLAGTSPQVKAGINAPVPFTKAACYAALRSIMGAEMPNCQGFTRPITVTAPPGSIVNPLPPAACGARGITGFRVMDCLFGALAQAVPDRVPADSNGGASIPSIGMTYKGRPQVFVETIMGNWGAAPTHDGQDGVAHMGANQSNVPIELIEAEYPLRIERYALVPDSGGPGRYRGGLAIQRDIRLLAEEGTLTLRSDKRRFPPFGLQGGQPGAPTISALNPEGEARTLPVLLTDPVTMRTGDVFHHRLAGAGGYGDPLERDPALVLRDLQLGKVTEAHARAAYGVVLRNGRVDEAATLRRREQMRGRAAASE